DTDCPDLHIHLSRCNSIKVESSCWVLYERPIYSGYQYVLTKGEDSDYPRWMGYNDTICSCHTFSYCPYFQGQMMEFSDDGKSVQDKLHSPGMYSCNILEDYWTVYKHSNYCSRHYFIRPSENLSLRRAYCWDGWGPSQSSWPWSGTACNRYSAGQEVPYE
uniref:Si:dkey-57a22.13 n=1 Tax=Electrophorus electricus TaxID=8005 RepID=A0AAY5ETP9_ELEEL